MSALVEKMAADRETLADGPDFPLGQPTGSAQVPDKIGPANTPPVAGTQPAAAPSDEPLSSQEVILEPPRSWQVINFRELWHFRDLLYFLAWRDVKIRYKQTFLGVAWAVLQPALLMIVFAVFFRNMAGRSTGDTPYLLFFYAGLLPWTFFATAISNGGNSVVGSERLITKVYFPRLAIPFAAVGAALVDFVVAGGLL